MAHAVTALHELEVFTSLDEPRTAAALARRHRLDAGMLKGVLDFVAARTSLLRAIAADRYVVTKDYSAHARFLLNLYAGAFRANAVNLAQVLRSPRRASREVDRSKHAAAFEGTAVRGGLLSALVRELGLNPTLDLGCGAGSLLVELATGNSDFRGWGIERNPAMCRVARKKVRDAKVSDRVRILRGDSRDSAAALHSAARKSVRGIIASQVANEMFAAGNRDAIAWLRKLRREFPGRLLLIADYYGQLGKVKGQPHRETLLHDYAQVISGQGVPPASIREWRRIYSAAGSRLVHALEDEATTLFIHVVVL